ncbi:MAG: carbohydrate ABC transporter permease [Treponema sp.]|jgi:multiple sugar transport system permease protein|nr:carbohydrate ABC transporter permease [Treponema sp.]
MIKQTGKQITDGLVFVVLSISSLVMITPFVWMILTAFKTYPETLAIPIKWLPSSLKLTNFTEVLSRLNFARYYMNTIIVAISITALQVLFCSMAGYGFARLNFPGRNVLFFILLSVLMIPSQMTLIPSFVLLSRLNWIDTFIGLIIPNVFSAYGTFFLRQFFMSLPGELEEAAIIDGCSRFGIYWRIFMPLCGTAVAAFSVFTVLWAWNDLMWPLIMTSKDSVRVLSVGIATLFGEHGSRYNLLMAASMLAIAPMIVLFLFLQKQFISGIAVTGLKA